MRQRSSKVFPETCRGLTGKDARPFDSAPEFILARRQPEGFKLRRLPDGVLAHQNEIARVRHQHQPVAAPIAGDLIAFSGKPSAVASVFHFDHAALRHLSRARAAFLHLLRCVKAEVGMPRAPIRQIVHRVYFRLE